MRRDAVAAVSFANYGARRSAATATLVRCVEDSGLPTPRTQAAIRICGGRKGVSHAPWPRGGAPDYGLGGGAAPGGGAGCPARMGGTWPRGRFAPRRP